ncbi:MAG TPA: serine/threonine-protein kinase, partial [Isosphaeraceae bacterium]
MSDTTRSDDDLTRRIDEACDRFEAAWRAGHRPRIEDDLRAVPAPGRAELLRQLLAVELAYRARGGEQPTPQEYRARFPGHEDPIRSAFEAMPSRTQAGDRPKAAAQGEADRDLLFCNLALQMGFLSRDALTAAMYAWALQEGQPLGQILVERGALTPDRRALLDALVRQYLTVHDGAPEASSAPPNAGDSTHVDPGQITAPYLPGSPPREVTRAGDPGHASDQSSTRIDSAGAPTYGGQRFRVLGPHAQGGLGVVYLALDTELNRQVALKEIRGEQAGHAESRARFLAEAEITGGLEHPGIVPVYGLGQHADGRPFYAMRFIQGDSLKEAIAHFHAAEGPDRDPGERALGLRKLLRRFLDVCYALEYAHSRGVLHRDLKPGNIMVGPYGETLIIDWGLAKVVGRPGGAGDAGESTPRPPSAGGPAETLPGAVVGTPAYMSPEQAAGALDRVGPASDVYSLGA